MGEPGKVATPARGQLNRIYLFFPLSPFAPESSSRGTGSAVLSRVSLHILHTQAESGAYSRDSSRFPLRRLFMSTVNRHRVSPQFIRLRNCVPMALIAESPPTQGQ